MHKAIRYIGSKQKILPFLEENLLNQLKDGDSFFDGFVGTGIVSQYVLENRPTIKITGGDISLYSEILFNILNIGNAFDNEEKIISLFEEFEKEPLVRGVIFNEFSHNGNSSTYPESRNFFHEKSGQTIDTFRIFVQKKLKNNDLTVEQSKILLYFLVAYSCKVANTTSVFGAYLKGAAKYQPFNVEYVKKILKDLKQIEKVKTKHSFYLGDIVNNLKVIPHQTVIYLDPPYSTRRYESNYHILNFIVNLNFNDGWLKPNSKTGQPKRISENPFASKKQTEDIFKHMIHEGVKKSQLLGISYNTDGLIKQQWMESFCAENGYSLETKNMTYQRFKSKQEVKNTQELQEILWLIKKQ